MASPGDNLLSIVTADWVNRVNAAVFARNLTASGRATVAPGRNGSQINVADPRSPVSTIQGILVGGTPPPVTDGTVIVDPFAWAGYSIQAGAFVLFAGTCTLDWFVGATAITWLGGIPVTTAGVLVQIPNPSPDTTNCLAIGNQLSVAISASSSDAAGLCFSLNTPF